LKDCTQNKILLLLLNYVIVKKNIDSKNVNSEKMLLLENKKTSALFEKNWRYKHQELEKNRIVLLIEKHVFHQNLKSISQ
jgi:hypothetical protein